MKTLPYPMQTHVAARLLPLPFLVLPTNLSTPDLGVQTNRLYFPTGQRNALPLATFETQTFLGFEPDSATLSFFQKND